MTRAPGQIIRAALLAVGLLFITACSAHTDAANSAVASATPATPGAEALPPASPPASAHAFTEGQQYVTLPLPAGQAAPTGPVEVIEVFSYACPHCAEFAPYMDRLRGQLPSGVEVRYMPAVFSPAYVPFAQAFYAARELGVLGQTHDAVFKAMLEHYPLNSLGDLAAFYARHGVDEKKFLDAATGPKTMQQMSDDQKTEMGWGINATPTLVVGRRANNASDAPFIALMRSADFGDYAGLEQLGSWMVDRVNQR